MKHVSAQPIHANTIGQLEAYVGELLRKEFSYEQLAEKFGLEQNRDFDKKAGPISKNWRKQLSVPSREETIIAEEPISEQLEEFVRWELFQILEPPFIPTKIDHVFKDIKQLQKLRQDYNLRPPQDVWERYVLIWATISDLQQQKSSLLKLGGAARKKKIEQLNKNLFPLQQEYASFPSRHRTKPWSAYLPPDPVETEKQSRDESVSKLLYLVEALLDFENEQGIKVDRKTTLAWAYNWLRKKNLVPSKDGKKLSEQAAYDMAKARIKNFENTASIEKLYGIKQFGSRYAALAMSGKFLPSGPIGSKAPNPRELKTFAKSIGRTYSPTRTAKFE